MMVKIRNRSWGLCFLGSLSCAGVPVSNLVGGARDQVRAQQAEAQKRAGQENRKRAETDRGEKRRADSRQKVVDARSRADADPKSPDAVDSYANAVLEFDSVLREHPDKSFDWSEQAGHAADLTQKIAVGAPGGSKKAHFYAQTGQGKLVDLFNLCVNMHPRRKDFQVPSDLDKMLPWASPKDLKQYKRSLGEDSCLGGNRVNDCMRACTCDPAQVVCACKEQCKADANACMVPYLQ